MSTNHGVIALVAVAAGSLAGAAFAARPSAGSYGGGFAVTGKVTDLPDSQTPVDESYGGTLTVGADTVQIEGAFAPLVFAMKPNGRLKRPIDSMLDDQNAFTAFGLANRSINQIFVKKTSGIAKKRGEFGAKVTVKMKLTAFAEAVGGTPPNLKAKLKIVFEGTNDV